jgi:hypothetical protein
MLRSLLSKLFARKRSTARSVGRRARLELLDLESRFLLSTVSWLRPVSGDWDNPANWSGGQVPGVSDPAFAVDDVVNPFRGITVTHATESSRAIVSLVNEATLDISAGSVQLTGSRDGTVPSRTDGLILVSGGTLTVGGEV